MKILLVVLMGTLLISGCAFVEKQATLPDGRAVFIDNLTGQGTLDAIDAEGTANEPMIMTTSAPWLESLATAGGAAPSPWGGILALLGSTVLGGLGLYHRSRNKKNAGLLAELVTSIEGNDTAHSAAIKLDHSPDLKEAVKAITA